MTLDEFRERRANLTRVGGDSDGAFEATSLLCQAFRAKGMPEDFIDGLAAGVAARHIDSVEADFRALLDVAATWGEDA